MMKQPAENTNATPTEELNSLKRVEPTIDPAELHNEIEQEARRLSMERGSEDYSQEDWGHAAEFVHNRRKSLSKG
jgi:hypothetical protein